MYLLTFTYIHASKLPKCRSIDHTLRVWDMLSNLTEPTPSSSWASRRHLCFGNPTVEGRSCPRICGKKTYPSNHLLRINFMEAKFYAFWRWFFTPPCWTHLRIWRLTTIDSQGLEKIPSWELETYYISFHSHSIWWWYENGLNFLGVDCHQKKGTPKFPGPAIFVFFGS